MNSKRKGKNKTKAAVGSFKFRLATRAIKQSFTFFHNSMVMMLAPPHVPKAFIQ